MDGDVRGVVHYLREGNEVETGEKGWNIYDVLWLRALSERGW